MSVLSSGRGRPCLWWPLRRLGRGGHLGSFALSPVSALCVRLHLSPLFSPCGRLSLAALLPSCPFLLIACNL